MPWQGQYCRYEHQPGAASHTPAIAALDAGAADGPCPTHCVLPPTVRDFLTGVDGVASAKPLSGRRVGLQDAPVLWFAALPALIAAGALLMLGDQRL